jgi:hypothetical protein
MAAVAAQLSGGAWYQQAAYARVPRSAEASGVATIAGKRSALSIVGLAAVIV